MIYGEAGSGKTALLHAVAHNAANAGALWLNATASPAEQAIPLAVFDQIFRRPELDTEQVRNAIAVLDELASGAERAGTRREGISASLAPALRELWSLLHGLTREQTVIVSVDDVHYADEYSLKFLLYLVGRLRSAPLLMIFTERLHVPQFESVLPADLPEQPCAHVVRLKPLSVCGVKRLLHERLGPRAARDLVVPIHQLSAGCPTLVQALVEDACGHGQAPGHPVPGAAFGQAVLRCVERSGGLVKSLARAVAILGESASPSLLGKVIDVDTEFAAHALAVFSDKGTVDERGFRQAAVRSAIIDSIPPKERMAMHRRVAELLHDEGAEASLVARHIIAAGSPHERWMISTLKDASEEALAEGDVGQAVCYLRLAHQICAGMSCDPADRAALTSLLVRAEWRCDPAATLRHLPLLESAAREGRLEGRHAVMLLTQLLWHGRIHTAVDVLEGILHRFYGSMTFEKATPSAADTCLLWLLGLYPDYLRGIASRDRDDVAPTFEPLAVTSQFQEAAVLCREMAEHNDENVVESAERILQNGRPNDKVAPLVTALMCLICVERIDAAAKWCDSLLREVTEPGAATWQAVFTALRGIIDLRRGDLVDTQRHADAALGSMSHKSWGVGIGVPLAASVSACVARGDLVKAEELLKTPVPEEMFLTPVGLLYLHARGHYHLESGRAHAALSDFRLCGKLMVRWDMDLPSFVPWRVDTAQACLRAGDEVTAKRIVEEQLELVSPDHHRARGLTLRVLAAVNPVRARPRILREALGELQLAGDRLESARVLADSSRVQHLLGNLDRARKFAKRARLLAEQCGADSLSRSILPDVPASMPATVADGAMVAKAGELSEAERRVASLAAAGHTNVEIARRLYVTVSTVEQHLTRVYRKLAVDRSELPSVLPPCHTDLTVEGSAAV